MKINNIVFKEYQAKDFQDFAMVVCVDFVKELFATKANEWWSDNVAVLAGDLAPETLVYAYEDYMALKKAAQQPCAVDTPSALCPKCGLPLVAGLGCIDCD
jgi:hypothetical protein